MNALPEIIEEGDPADGQEGDDPAAPGVRQAALQHWQQNRRRLAYSTVGRALWM